MGTNPQADYSVKIPFATFRNRADTKPVAQALYWDELSERLTTYRVGRKDGEMFSPATFRKETKRANQNVSAVSLLVHDFDHNVDQDAIRKALAPYDHVIYSTHSSRPDAPRLRAVVRLSRSVSPTEHRDLLERAQEHLYHGKADEAAKAASQAFYFPARPSDDDYQVIAIVGEGRPLDPGELPAGTKRHQGRSGPIPEVMHDGERNQALVSIAGSLRLRGITTASVLAALRAVNENQCDPPLEDWRIQAIAESTTSWWEPPAASETDCCSEARAENAALRSELNEVRTMHEATMSAIRNANVGGEKLTAIAAIYECASAESRGLAEDRWVEAPLARIAEQSGFSPGTCSNHLKRLDERGVIGHQTRRRVVEVLDTETGELRPEVRRATYIRLVTNPVGDLQVLATLEKREHEKAGGARIAGTCPQHPTAGTVIVPFHACAKCGRALEPVEVDHADERVNTEIACLLDSAPTTAPPGYVPSTRKLRVYSENRHDSDASTTMFVEPIPASDAGVLVRAHHYLGAKGFRAEQCYGLFDGMRLVGAAVFHGPSAPETVVGAFGLPRDEQDGIWELGRLVLMPEYNGRKECWGTWFLARALRLLRGSRPVRAVISYADSGCHQGTIYQAASFTYCGLSAPKSDYWIDGKIRERGSEKGGEWKPRTQKHRYIRVYDKRLELKWPSASYPKDTAAMNGSHP